MSAPIFDKRKQVVASERSIRCRRTGVRITNRIELHEDSVPPVVEHVTMESIPGWAEFKQYAMGDVGHE